MDILSAIILGIIEGLTEFLPVSSTGHMILSANLMGLEQTEFLKAFEIIIQLGAIMAVVLIFKEKVFKDFNLWKKLIAAFIPTGVIGLLLHKIIKSLFDPSIVAYMLIFWGVIFIIIELLHKKKENYSITTIEDISYKKAIAIGFAQCFAMVPGTSRSGATIIGGLLLGMNRKIASEFSFLLAIPTMMAATGYDILKNHNSFSSENILPLLVGFVVSFIVAYGVIKWFLAFIRKHTFIPFGIYRVIVGVVFLLFIL